VVASTPSDNSLHLKVEIVTTDTQEVKSVNALVDCRATGPFMDRDYVVQNKITTRNLSRAIPVYNVDGTPNEAGSIWEVVDVILRYKDHSEHAHFAVTGLRKQDAILGYTWLQEHNPEVDWSTKQVKMSRCPGRCSTCRTEIKQECHQWQTGSRHLHACRAGPLPTVEEIFKDVPQLYSDSEDDSKDDLDYDPDVQDEITEGDQIFMTMIHDPAEII